MVWGSLRHVDVAVCLVLTTSGLRRRRTCTSPFVPFLKPTGIDRPDASSRCTCLVCRPIASQIPVRYRRPVDMLRYRSDTGCDASVRCTCGAPAAWTCAEAAAMRGRRRPAYPPRHLADQHPGPPTRYKALAACRPARTPAGLYREASTRRHDACPLRAPHRLHARLPSLLTPAPPQAAPLGPPRPRPPPPSPVFQPGRGPRCGRGHEASLWHEASFERHQASERRPPPPCTPTPLAPLTRLLAAPTGPTDPTGPTGSSAARPLVSLLRPRPSTTRPSGPPGLPNPRLFPCRPTRVSFRVAQPASRAARRRPPRRCCRGA